MGSLYTKGNLLRVHQTVIRLGPLPFFLSSQSVATAAAGWLVNVLSWTIPVLSVAFAKLNLNKLQFQFNVFLLRLKRVHIETEIFQIHNFSILMIERWRKRGEYFRIRWLIVWPRTKSEFCDFCVVCYLPNNSHSCSKSWNNSISLTDDEDDENDGRV